MTPNYGLQCQVTIPDGGGSAYLHDKTLKFENAQLADLETMLGRVKVCKCEKCGKPAFDPSSVQTNRSGGCEACFMEALNKKYEQSMAREKAKRRKLDEQRKAQGFTHKVEAWVHPEAGGSDYEIVLFAKSLPTAALIQKELKKRRSAVMDDYVVSAL
jgi:hypothetical protein